MRLLLLFALLCSTVVAKYSYTDKCYCYEGRVANLCKVIRAHSHLVVVNDQYYLNKKGVPIGRDRIVYPGRYQSGQPTDISVYYQ